MTCVGHVIVSFPLTPLRAGPVHDAEHGNYLTLVHSRSMCGLLTAIGQPVSNVERSYPRSMTHMGRITKENHMSELEQVSTGKESNRQTYYYSQAIRVGEFLFVSGQAALDDSGNVVGRGDFDTQAEQVFSNLESVLKAGGSDFNNVVKVTIFMTDISFFPRIIELRKRFFTAPYPADTTVEVRSLALEGLMLEIEAIALIRTASNT